MDRAVLLNDITKIASVGLKLLEDLPWNWLAARFFSITLLCEQKDFDTQHHI